VVDRPVSTKQIGDGKLPNKFWVSISEDYYVVSEPGVMDWASDQGIIKNPRGKTLAVFSSYKAARNFVDNELPELGREYDDGISVNTITIEDRISGEVFWRGIEFDPQHGDRWENERTDLDFTNKTVAARIAKARKPRRKKSAPSGLGGIR